MAARTFLNILLTFSEILLTFFSFAEFADTKSFYRNLSPFCSFLLNALGFLLRLQEKQKHPFYLPLLGHSTSQRMTFGLVIISLLIFPASNDH